MWNADAIGLQRGTCTDMGLAAVYWNGQDLFPFLGVLLENPNFPLAGKED